MKLSEAEQARISEIIGKMSVEEKVSQLVHTSPAVDHVGIDEYNWWNEGLHGVARAGLATVFPQAIALAATFDEELVHEVADAISDEARAKYNGASASGNRGQYRGLTYWTPNINIFRDPRWGRGQETYGEDPFLTSRIGLAFMKGLQGNNPERLKLAACAKHFAVHSGPEALRHTFDAVCSLKDLHETYLPAFKALVDAGVESVMGAYNRTLGEPCCGSALLLKDILRGRWKFQGHVVSDCWAIRDFHEFHKVTRNAVESAALALNMGCDLNCGCTYPVLVEAFRLGLVSMETIDTSLRRLLETRFRLGMFDESGSGPWDKLGPETVHSDSHVALSRKAAEKSIVLLKNDKNILPLDDSARKILLIGPGAANAHTLLANYHGLSPRLVTILEGIADKTGRMDRVTVDYHPGVGMYDKNRNNGWTIGMAEAADLVIAVFGLDNQIEGEEGDAIASVSKGDRDSIELPEWQLDYLKAIRSRGTPVVLVLTGGSPISVPEDIADAILFAWYPGEQGGAAVADILFGDVVPSGKLPVTFPVSTDQLPPYDSYDMAGRTYRYMKADPLYPFGFGLSYTRFEFGALSLSAKEIRAGGSLTVAVPVKNTGSRDAEEVVQLYVSKKNAAPEDPLYSLRGFVRVSVPAGGEAEASFDLDDSAFAVVDAAGNTVPGLGEWIITVADAAPSESGVRKGAVPPVRGEVSFR